MSKLQNRLSIGSFRRAVTKALEHVNPPVVVQLALLAATAGALLSLWPLRVAVLADASTQRVWPADPSVDLWVRQVQTGLLATLVVIAGLLVLAVLVRFAARTSLRRRWAAMEARLMAELAAPEGGAALLMAAFVLSGAALLAAMPLVTHLLASPWPFLDERPRFSSADRRWLILFYNLFWFCLIVVPFIAAWFLRQVANTGWHKFVFAPRAARMPLRLIAGRRGLAIGLRSLVGFVLAWFLFGPPWNIEIAPHALNDHLMESLLSLQAIQEGALPYVGPASYGYGPGMQLISYLYQLSQGGLSVAGQSESYLFMNWIMASVYFPFAFGLFGYRVGAVFTLFMLLASPLAAYHFYAAGYFIGLFGWATAIRGMSLPIVAISLALILLRRDSGRAGLWLAGLTGLFGGLCAYISQENGSLMIVTLGSVLAIAVAGRIAAMPRAFAVFLSFLAGAAVIPAIVAVYYAAHGELGEFVANYQEVPSMAFDGLTGMYLRATEPPYRKMLIYFGAAFVFLTGLFAMLRFQPLRLAIPLDENRFLILAAVISILCGFNAGLIRLDYGHFQASLSGFPLLMAILAAAALRTGRVPTRAGAAVVLAGTAALFYFHNAPRVGPGGLIAHEWNKARNRAAVFLEDRVGDAHLPEYGRLTAGIVERTICCQQPTGDSGRELLALLDQLKAEVGDARVYMESYPGYGRTGAFAFLADLRVSPVMQELNTRFPTYPSVYKREEFVAANVEDIDVMVTANIEARLPSAVLRRFPDALVEQSSHKDLPYYLIWPHGRTEPRPDTATPVANPAADAGA